MPSIRKPAKGITHRFNYHDDDGNVVAQKYRIDLGNGEKTFRQRRLLRESDFSKLQVDKEYRPYSFDGSWWIDEITDDSIKALPYRPGWQQDLIGDRLPDRIYVTEGERDADAVGLKGKVATTILQVGYERQWAEYLRDFPGVALVVVDNDPTGAVQGLARHKALIDVGVRCGSSDCGTVQPIGHAPGGSLASVHSCRVSRRRMRP